MKSIESHNQYYITLCGKVLTNKWSTKKPNNELTELKPSKKNGYLFVCFTDNYKSINKYIHRLIAQSFIPNPNNKPFINHINGIKTDNRISNLEWCTNKENINHAISIGLINNKGEHCTSSKLTEKEVFEIRKDTRSQRIIAKDYNISQSVISSIKLRKTWKHL
jgi:hypothetical protein